MEPEFEHHPFPPQADEPGAPAPAEALRDQRRLTYQLCRLGFGILSGALLLACFSSVLGLSVPFGGRPVVVWLENQGWWRWHDAPIVWGTLLGTYLLWGRWKDRAWQRRAGLLLLMCGADLALWFLDHLGEFGLRDGEAGHAWLRGQFGQFLGWAEFTLLASLACELMAHLGAGQAPEAGKATRSLAATGAVVWVVQFCERTAWGWPLLDKGIRSPESLLLMMGTHMIWTITLIQVTALTVSATRQTSRALAEMAREDRRDDEFRGPAPGDGSRPRDDEDPWRAPRDRSPWA